MKKFQTALSLSSISALIVVVLLAQNALATDLPVSVTQFSYDARGQLLCQTQRMNPATFNALPDACVLGTEGSFGKDRVTQNFYDAAGQLIQVKQGVGTPDQRSYSTFSYSQNGKIIDTIDANGNRTHNIYDGFDRLSQINYPSSVRATSFNGSSQATALSTANAYSTMDYETFAYDANNNKTSWRRRDGNVINYVYDNLNRQITMDLPGQTAGDVYTTYDVIGNILSKKFASFSGVGVSYTYDGIGRIISTTDMNNRTLSYEYNKANARTRLTYPDGVYIGYTLDAINRVSGVGYNSTVGLFTQTYDNLGRLVGIGKGGVGATTFAYDGVGRLVSQTNDLPGTVNDVTYGFTAYNPANQIMGISINNNAYEFQQSAAISNSKSFDGLNHIVGFGYDARSNLTSDGVRNFAFDILNRMTSFSGGGNNGTLTYDPEGRLVSQVINGAITSFLYDGTEMIAEYNSAGTVLRKYVHSTRDDDPQVWLEGAGNSDIRYVYANYQGSVVATTNATGSTVQLYKYDPYGIPKDASNNDSWQGFRFRYTGQQIIPEAKLYYYKARVYDPDLGIFLQTDPIGTKDDLNLYAYVKDDPINFIDTVGLCTGSRLENKDGTCSSTGGFTTGSDGALQGMEKREQQQHNESQNYQTEKTESEKTNQYAQSITPIEPFLQFFARPPLVGPVPRPSIPFPTDLTKPPGPGFNWKGNGPPGSSGGSWVHPKTGESFHPDMGHKPPVNPHIDWSPMGRNGSTYRWFPDGTVEPKSIVPASPYSPGVCPINMVCT